MTVPALLPGSCCYTDSHLHQSPVQHDLQRSTGRTAPPQRLPGYQRQSAGLVLDVGHGGHWVEIGLQREFVITLPFDHLKYHQSVGFLAPNIIK